MFENTVHSTTNHLSMKLENENRLLRVRPQENAHYLQYLLRLVELESAQRAANALQARIKQAAFPVHKDLDTYDFSLMASLSKQKIVELTRCQWLDQHENVCLLGSQGVGKTHLAIALGLAACRAGRRVRFFTAAALINRLEETQKQYQLDRFLSQLDRADLLITSWATSRLAVREPNCCSRSLPIATNGPVC